MSGFPNRNAHPPLLSKTSNSPSNVTPPSTITPFHTASEGMISPLAIRSRRLDNPHPDNLCLTIRNTDEHMAPTIAPPSNNALTRTVSPCGPSSWSICLNGTSSPPAFRCSSTDTCPTEYKSIRFEFASSLGTFEPAAVASIQFTSSIRALGAASSSSMLTALPRFPAAHYPQFLQCSSTHNLLGLHGRS